MRVFVTGGSGFIGTNLIDHLIASNITFINFDIAAPRNKAHYSYWFKGDLLDEAGLEKKVLEFNPTHVVHLAARTDLRGKTLFDYKANHIGTYNLIRALKKVLGVKKVVFTSSMLVCKVGYCPKGPDDYYPTTVYGESKVEMEKVIKENGHNYNWVITRPTSIWGPWFGEPYKDFFLKVLNRKYFNFKRRSGVKTFGFVYNTVLQIKTLLFNDEIKSGLFYLGDDPPLDIAHWANLIAQKFYNGRVKELPYALFYSAAFVGDILNFVGIKFPLTTFRLKNMTTNNVISLHDINGLCPKKYNSEEGVDITIQWMKQEVL